MNIPGLGELSKDARYGWYCSTPVRVAVVGDQLCTFLVEGYEVDDSPADFDAAIRNFLAADESVLRAATPFVYAYCQDRNADWDEDDPEFVSLATPEDVWKHVRLGTQPSVQRRPYGDQQVYISLECECDWEPEHGLQLVFRKGAVINKVGPYDGHLTNSDAYARDELEDVIYR
jgi:hypothetical protein